MSSDEETVLSGRRVPTGFSGEVEVTNEFTPKFDLADKVVLVTGASRGIGHACALACAGSGADMIVGVRSGADGADITAEIERIGRRALAVQMDLTDLTTVRKAVADAHAAFGRIDVLVNNVGHRKTSRRT